MTEADAGGWATDAAQCADVKAATQVDRAQALESNCSALLIAFNKVEELTADLDEAKKDYNALATSIVPGLMDDLKIPVKFVVDGSGTNVAIECQDTFECYVLVADEDKLRRWVRTIGQGELIKKKKSWAIDKRSLTPLVRNYVDGPNGKKLPKWINVFRGRFAKVKVPRKKKT